MLVVCNCGVHAGKWIQIFCKTSGALHCWAVCLAPTLGIFICAYVLYGLNAASRGYKASVLPTEPPPHPLWPLKYTHIAVFLDNSVGIFLSVVIGHGFSHSQIIPITAGLMWCLLYIFSPCLTDWLMGNRRVLAGKAEGGQWGRSKDTGSNAVSVCGCV